MKKKNNKGFTLVELLAVVVILLAISVIAVSSISAAMERQKDNQDEATKKIIFSYARTYFDDYQNTSGSCVNVDTLITTYNLDTDTLKDKNGNLFDGSVNKNYQYNYYILTLEITILINQLEKSLADQIANLFFHHLTLHNKLHNPHTQNYLIF